MGVFKGCTEIKGTKNKGVKIKEKIYYYNYTIIKYMQLGTLTLLVYRASEFFDALILSGLLND